MEAQGVMRSRVVLVGWLVLVAKVVACRAPDAPEVRVAKVVTAVPEAVGSEAPRSASPSRASRQSCKSFRDGPLVAP
jgi:hypothetical protein